MKNISLLTVLLVGTAAALSGCATRSGSDTVLKQPPIEGRVIDADTQMPIEHVVVLRDPQASVPGDENYVSIGEVKTRQESIYSDRDGQFKVSEEDADFDGRRVWTSVTLKFLHPDYHMHSAEFSYAEAMMAGDAATLHTGDITLRRLPAGAPDQE